MIRGRKLCDCGKYFNQNLNACPHCGAPEWSCTHQPYNPLDWVYDLETYPNIFTASFKHVATGTRHLFEISDRKDDARELYQFLNVLAGADCRLVGFNNVGFDYPIIHYFINNHHLNPGYPGLYDKAQSIINTPWENRFNNVVWESDTHIKQIDLFKVHHFDNDSKRTSLKMLEFNMRADNVQDLPYTPGTALNDQQKDVLIKYNDHDVDETERFLIHSIGLIEFRELLGAKYGRNYLNYNDTKIGKDYFVMELETACPGACYYWPENCARKTTRQTVRDSINLGEVIFPYIKFIEPEFERVKQWLAAQCIRETKGVFKNLSATVKGFKYVFGVGGIHGSIDPCIVESNDTHVLYDWDVASYYPNISIKNHLYPEHLSDLFCDIYQDVYEQRQQYKKGTPENAMLKLALNGVYGDSNNKYSPFYDPKYTMSITINGQLLLCMLAQYLVTIPDLKMIQINTDGLTVLCPRGAVEHMNAICKWWQDYTCLELEHVIYNRMFVRDVNNYIGEYENGKLKRKGAYAYTRVADDPNTMEMQWHQDQSALVVPMAAEAALVRGECVDTFIRNHQNIFDFMLRTKINRADKLIFNDAFGNERELQRITRYYISNDAGAGALTKISPPAKGAIVGSYKRANGLTDQFYSSVIAELNNVWRQESEGHLPWDARINTKNRSKYTIRRTGLNVGYLVTPCNDIKDANRSKINFGYYIAEAKKLIEPLRK